MAVNVPRALPSAPKGYRPTEVDCPDTRPAIRSAAHLSPHETSWLKDRRQKALKSLIDFFSHVHIADFDTVSYINKVSGNISNVPNIGIAVSGGGYRALMNGAGALKAFDSRTSNSTSTGHLGGLLQSSTYIAGLSGGGWLLGSIYMNNFSSVSSLQTHEAGDPWQFSSSMFVGPAVGGDALGYFEAIQSAVQAKRDAGYHTSITDYWGRALSYQLIKAPDGGVNYTWSSIAQTNEFKQGEMPLPMLVADGRNPGELTIKNVTVYEFSPWEFGTFDPTIYGFVPLEYLGSKFEAGKLLKDESCVRGFDNAGFVMGSSSTLFNQFLLNVNSTKIPKFIKEILNNILTDIGDKDYDIARYTPNPFYKYSSSPLADSTSLDVVDGGEDLQNLPLHPLIQPERNVDVIFAVDSSADTDKNWPNGTALIATYERSLDTIANKMGFPAVPDVNTFLNLGLNTRPAFFGCNSSNITGTGTSPLVVYIPNYPYVTHSNVSTFDPAYDDIERDAIILNGYNVATMANSTRDKDWSACVGCAILSRSLERTRTPIPDICNRCFDRYCWDGKLDTKPSAGYYPDLFLSEVNPTSVAGKTALFPGFGIVVLTTVILFHHLSLF
ncbi:lysophospholipase catalytic domain-containing protein [Aspergillus caelatus]|uniref:Lysophospholipase n=1 Tax=Aspergillus caelatus TaxID=61420 RepID=A0A5N6ZZS2_9EURO|nr:lysophospholipase catalytic domain-containing protein [Aspergillus caelatus]KAE8362915.1 lysophospholipase catalytic domain-containing protein [Aspergillus caelatus]